MHLAGQPVRHSHYSAWVNFHSASSAMLGAVPTRSPCLRGRCRTRDADGYRTYPAYRCASHTVEKERMKESYSEGVATHADPESCGGDREVAVEALDRGTCAPGIEPRN